MKRLGILGGTFDPIHYGHLRLAEEAIETLALDEMLLIPSAKNPLKSDPNMSSAQHRLQMVEMAADNHPKLTASRIEIERGGDSYTVETLQTLRGIYPSHDFHFVAGADSLHSLPHWYQVETILELCYFVVATRPGYDIATTLQNLPSDWQARIIPLEMTPMPISATELRARVASNRSIRYFTLDCVIEYIRQNRLYSI